MGRLARWTKDFRLGVAVGGGRKIFISILKKKKKHWVFEREAGETATAPKRMYLSPLGASALRKIGSTNELFVENSF